MMMSPIFVCFVLDAVNNIGMFFLCWESLGTNLFLDPEELEEL